MALPHAKVTGETDEPEKKQPPADKAAAETSAETAETPAAKETPPPVVKATKKPAGKIPEPAAIAKDEKKETPQPPKDEKPAETSPGSLSLFFGCASAACAFVAFLLRGK